MKMESYLILLLIGLSACSNVHLNLVFPETTQSGQKIFVCKVNGKEWIPTKGNAINGLSIGCYKGSFYIHAQRVEKNTTTQYIYLRKANTRTEGSYSFHNSETDQANYTYLENSCNYRRQAIENGHLTITRLDTINGIVSGRFDFIVKQKNCPDIEVTDGYFDYTYR